MKPNGSRYIPNGKPWRMPWLGFVVVPLLWTRARSGVELSALEQAPAAATDSSSALATGAHWTARNPPLQISTDKAGHCQVTSSVVALGHGNFVIECSGDAENVTVTFSPSTAARKVYDSKSGKEMSSVFLKRPETEVTKVEELKVQECPLGIRNGTSCEPYTLKTIWSAPRRQPRLQKDGLRFSRLAGRMNPAFDPNIFSYEVPVHRGEAVTITAVAAPGFFSSFDKSRLTEVSCSIRYTPELKGKSPEILQVFVSNYHGEALSVYSLRMIPADGDNPQLATVSVSPGRMEPSFTPEVYAYNYRIPPNAPSVSMTFTPVAKEGTICTLQQYSSGDKKGLKSVKIGPSGQVSVALPRESNLLSLVADCVAQDKKHTARYLLSVVRQHGGSTALDSVEILGGVTMDQPFDPLFGGPYHITSKSSNWPGRAKKTSEDVIRWIKIQFSKRNPQALVTLNGTPIVEEHFQYLRVVPGKANVLKIAVSTPQNPVKEEYVFIFNQNLPWYEKTAACAKLGNYLGWVSTVISATSPASFIRNQKFLQLVSLTTQISGIPDSYKSFAEQLHKFNFQWTLPAKVYFAQGNVLESTGSGHTQLAVNSGKKDAFASLDNSSNPSLAGSTPFATELSTSRGSRILSSAVFDASNRAVSRMDMLELDRKGAYRQLDARFRDEMNLLSYSACLANMTIFLLAAVLLFSLTWIFYLRDPSRGITCLRKDYPAFLNPTVFWTFLLDWTMISYARCSLGILFLRTLRKRKILVLGFQTTATHLSVLSVFVALVPILTCVLGSLVLISIEGDLCFSEVLQKYADRKCEELKATYSSLKMLPILKQFFKVTVQSVINVVPPKDHLSYNKGVCLRFYDAQTPRNLPLLVGSLKTLKLMSLNNQDVDLESEVRDSNGYTLLNFQDASVADNLQQTLSSYNAKHSAHSVILSQDAFENMMDSFPTKTYKRFPEARLGYCFFTIRNTYDQEVQVKTSIKIKDMLSMLNLRSYSLWVPTENLSLPEADKWGLLLTDSLQGNLLHWAISRFTTLLLIILLYSIPDPKGVTLLLLFLFASVATTAVSLPSMLLTASTRWWIMMHHLMFQSSKIKPEELVFSRWPFKNNADLKHKYSFLKRKKAHYFGGVLSYMRKYFIKPWVSLQSSEFWNTRLWMSIKESVKSPVFLSSSQSIIFAALLGSNESLNLLDHSTGYLISVATFIIGLCCLNFDAAATFVEEMLGFIKYASVQLRRVLITLIHWVSQPRSVKKRFTQVVFNFQVFLAGKASYEMVQLLGFPNFCGDVTQDFLVSEVSIINNEIGVSLKGKLCSLENEKSAGKSHPSVQKEKDRFNIHKTVHARGSVPLFRSNADSAMPIQLPFKQFYSLGEGKNYSNSVKRLACTVQIVNNNYYSSATRNTDAGDSFLSLFANPELMPEHGKLNSKLSNHGYVVRWDSNRKALIIKGPSIRLGTEYSVMTIDKVPPASMLTRSSLSATVHDILEEKPGKCVAEAFCEASGILLVEVVPGNTPDLEKEISITDAKGFSFTLNPLEVKVDFYRRNISAKPYQGEMILRSRQIKRSSEPYTVLWERKIKGIDVQVPSVKCETEGTLQVYWVDSREPNLSNYLLLSSTSTEESEEKFQIYIDPLATDLHQFFYPTTQKHEVFPSVSSMAGKCVRAFRTLFRRSLPNELPDIPIPCTIVQCVNPKEREYRVEPNFTEAVRETRARIEYYSGMKNDLNSLERLSNMWTEFMTISEFADFWEAHEISTTLPSGTTINPLTCHQYVFQPQLTKQKLDQATKGLLLEVTRRLDRRIQQLHVNLEKLKTLEKAYSDSQLYEAQLLREREEWGASGVYYDLERDTRLRKALNRVQRLKKIYELRLPDPFQYPITLRDLDITQRENFREQMNLWKEELKAWLMQTAGASSSMSELGSMSCVDETVNDVMRCMEKVLRRSRSAQEESYKSVLHYMVSFQSVRGKDRYWNPNSVAAHYCKVRLFGRDADDPSKVDYSQEVWTPCFLKLESRRILMLFPHEKDAFSDDPHLAPSDMIKRFSWNQLQGYYIPLDCFEQFLLSMDASISDDRNACDDVKQMEAKLVLHKATDYPVDDFYVKYLYTDEFNDDLVYDEDSQTILKIILCKTVLHNGESISDSDFQLAKVTKKDSWASRSLNYVLPLTFRFHEMYYDQWMTAIKTASMNTKRTKQVPLNVFDGRLSLTETPICDRNDTKNKSSVSKLPLETTSILHSAVLGEKTVSSSVTSSHLSAVETESVTSHATTARKSFQRESNSEVISRPVSRRESPKDHSSGRTEFEHTRESEQGITKLPHAQNAPAAEGTEYYTPMFRDFRISAKEGVKIHDTMTGNLVYEGALMEGKRWGNGKSTFMDSYGKRWEFEGKFIDDEIFDGTLKLVDEDELENLQKTKFISAKSRILQISGKFDLPRNLRVITESGRNYDLRRLRTNCAARDTSDLSMFLLSRVREDLYDDQTDMSTGSTELFDLRRSMSGLPDEKMNESAISRFYPRKPHDSEKSETQHQIADQKETKLSGLNDENLPSYSPSEQSQRFTMSSFESVLHDRQISQLKKIDPNVGLDEAYAKNCIGTVSLADGTVYYGSLSHGVFEGRGTLYCKKCQLVLNGFWSRGVPNGRCYLMQNLRGSGEMMEYFGELKNGLRNSAHGTQLALNGHVIIQGEFKQDVLEGPNCSLQVSSKVIKKYPKFCMKYVGPVKNSMPNGKGKIVWPDGAYFTGDIVNGMMTGEGILRDSSHKLIYNGCWLNNLPEGIVRCMVFPDGDTYTGNIRKGKRVGAGKLSSKGVTIYDGFWVNDLPEGRGTLQTVGGIYEGEFRKGKRHGVGKFEVKNAASNPTERPCVYEGHWENDQPHGIGRYVDQLGNSGLYRFENGALVSLASKKGHKKKEELATKDRRVPKAEPYKFKTFEPKYWGLTRVLDLSDFSRFVSLGQKIWKRHQDKPYEFMGVSEGVPAEYICEEIPQYVSKENPWKNLSSEPFEVTKLAVNVNSGLIKSLHVEKKKLSTYCVVRVDQAGKSTKPLDNVGKEPKWNARMNFDLPSLDTSMDFQLWEKVTLKTDNMLGEGKISLNSLWSSETRTPVTLDIPLFANVKGVPETTASVNVTFSICNDGTAAVDENVVGSNAKTDKYNGVWEITICSVSNLFNETKLTKIDAYVICSLGNQKKKTKCKTVGKGVTPMGFKILLPCSSDNLLRLEVWDYDPLAKDNFIGSSSVELEKFSAGTLAILREQNNKNIEAGFVNLEVSLIKNNK